MKKSSCYGVKLESVELYGSVRIFVAGGRRMHNCTHCPWCLVFHSRAELVAAAAVVAAADENHCQRGWRVAGALSRPKKQRQMQGTCQVPRNIQYMPGTSEY